LFFNRFTNVENKAISGSKKEGNDETENVIVVVVVIILDTT
jgi:hypothetical protein